jgi:hypothetical protein
MRRKGKRTDLQIELLAAAAISACNEYIESKFKDEDYEDYSPQEKLRIIKVLKTNALLDARYKA